MLTISGRDILRLVGTQFRPFASNVCNTKYHTRCRPVAMINIRRIGLHLWFFNHHVDTWLPFISIFYVCAVSQFWAYDTISLRSQLNMYCKMYSNRSLAYDFSFHPSFGMSEYEIELIVHLLMTMHSNWIIMCYDSTFLIYFE